MAKNPPQRDGDAYISFTQNIFNGDSLPPAIFNQLNDADKDWVKKQAEKEQEARHEWAFQEQENRRDHELAGLSAGKLVIMSG